LDGLGDDGGLADGGDGYLEFGGVLAGHGRSFREGGHLSKRRGEGHGRRRAGRGAWWK
jgi:hypothetical protein